MTLLFTSTSWHPCKHGYWQLISDINLQKLGSRWIGYTVAYILLNNLLNEKIITHSSPPTHAPRFALPIISAVRLSPRILKLRGILLLWWILLQKPQQEKWKMLVESFWDYKCPWTLYQFGETVHERWEWFRILKVPNCICKQTVRGRNNLQETAEIDTIS